MQAQHNINPTSAAQLSALMAILSEFLHNPLLPAVPMLAHPLAQLEAQQ
ncbi:hypothetical protein [Billgrantia montanilacus]|nr:hypothetical protein [Halomonas montanilacus]